MKFKNISGLFKVGLLASLLCLPLHGERVATAPPLNAAIQNFGDSFSGIQAGLYGMCHNVSAYNQTVTVTVVKEYVVGTISLRNLSGLSGWNCSGSGGAWGCWQEASINTNASQSMSLGPNTEGQVAWSNYCVFTTTGMNCTGGTFNMNMKPASGTCNGPPVLNNCIASGAGFMRAVVRFAASGPVGAENAGAVVCTVYTNNGAANGQTQIAVPIVLPVNAGKPF